MDLYFTLSTLITMLVFGKLIFVAFEIKSWYIDNHSDCIIFVIGSGSMLLTLLSYFVFQDILDIILSNFEWFVNMSFGNQASITFVPSIFFAYVFAAFTKNVAIDYSLKKGWITKLESRRRVTKSYMKKEE
ncbi:hypothetical protein HNP92_001817 [Methanococcus maripaludis]|uniref:Uncharacterized protein n=1 Tax=Methanococcus maripaludis TaxID=39152 RepID=A0A7J9S763_METMI|nr:hypothetical protein [Methanococcus maripaludis]MBB6402495.1 hypothetical protein [Methanococcus maripaludis]